MSRAAEVVEAMPPLATFLEGLNKDAKGSSSSGLIVETQSRVQVIIDELLLHERV